MLLTVKHLVLIDPKKLRIEKEGRAPSFKSLTPVLIFYFPEKQGDFSKSNCAPIFEIVLQFLFYLLATLYFVCNRAFPHNAIDLVS